MFVYYRLHVIHAAVADLDVVLVEETVVFVLVREVLRYKSEECSSDVSLYVFAKRRVVPNDVSLSVSSGTCWLVGFVVV